MGSEVIKIPTIDFRKPEVKLQGSEEWISVRDQVFKALAEYGLFEALVDGVSKEHLYEKLKQVFDFPLDAELFAQTAVEYARDIPMLPDRIVLYDILNPNVVEGFSKILWPAGEPELCDLVLSYAKSISEFDEMVRKMVFEKLGMEKYWDEHTKLTSCALGFNKYKLPKDEESKTEELKIGLLAHTDKKISTIISQQKENGLLQVLNKNGQWFDVEYSPDSFIFVVNDCWKALTNGILQSPLHRVIMGNEERYSMAFSTLPKKGYIIKVPEELVDEDHPLLFKPFEGTKYFEYCLTGGPSATLERFCGV